LCCATFLVDFEPVSVRMAKDQDLPLNPMRISGACGRLMCCLKYEHPLYRMAGAEGASCEKAGTCSAHKAAAQRMLKPWESPESIECSAE
jgi:hypothetical protein